jgi:ketosteroid isomerase-like protein
MAGEQQRGVLKMSSASTVAGEITAVEATLRVAMLAPDLETLAQLLSPRLVFTDQAGRLYGKEDDLEAHRSGLLRLSMLEIQETKILEIGHVAAVVNALVRLTGTYGSNSFDGTFRYTRTWTHSESGQWQVLAGHVSAVESATEA